MLEILLEIPDTTSLTHSKPRDPCSLHSVFYSSIVLGTLGGALLLAAGACSKSVPDGVNVKRGDEQQIAAADWPEPDITVTGSIQLDQRSVFEGTIAAVQASPTTLAHGAEIALENDAILVGAARGDTLFLGDRARVTGNAAYNSKHGNGTVQGDQSSPLTLPLSIQIPELPPIAVGTQDVSLASSGQSTLDPGAYRDVTLLSGNGGIPTVMTLSGGVYAFRRLALANDARMECSAPCEIRMSESVNVGARSKIGPANVSGMGAGNVQLLVAQDGPSAVVLQDDSDLFAYVLAPNGRVTLGHRVELGGKVVARHVRVGIDLLGEGLQLPLFEQHPQSLTVWEGEPAVFTVAATGEDISLQWQKNGQNIPGEIDDMLVIESAAVEDDGSEFRVLASNEAGTVVSKVAELTVIPCQELDTECDGIDEDCDGAIDEDFELYCVGSARFWCEAGVIKGTSCSNGVLCDGEETCSAGICGSGPNPADDGNDCTLDICNEVTGVENPPASVGTNCLAGAGPGVCDGQGTCVPGPDPFVSCVANLPDGSYAAWFGYSYGGFGLEIPHGDENFVFPASSSDLFQSPTVFEPGTTERAFTQRFHGSQTVIWNIGGQVVVASRFSQACPQAVRPAEVRGAMFTTLGQKPLGYRTHGGFRSSGFHPPPGSDFDTVSPTAEQDLFDPSPNLPTSPSVVRVEFLNALATFDDGCGYGEPYAKVGVAGGTLTKVDVPQNECDLFTGCIGGWTWEPPVVLEMEFPPDQQAASIAVEVWDEDDCLFESEDDLQGTQTTVLDLTTSSTTAIECLDGDDTGLCYQIVVEPGEAPPQVPGYARLCFEWTTNFVDNALGEDKVGETLVYTEQRFPARHAEYQLQVENAFGTRTLGAHYDDTGQYVAGKQRFLDAEGCIEDGLLRTQLLVHRPGQQIDQGGLNFRARLRTLLAKSHTRNTPVYRCNGNGAACKSDSDCTNVSCIRAQVCDAGSRETPCPTLGATCASGGTCIEQPFPAEFSQAYSVGDAEGGAKTVTEYSGEFGSWRGTWSSVAGYTVPPAPVPLASIHTDPLLNAAVALGDVLTLEDNGFIDTESSLMPAVVGNTGAIDCKLTGVQCAVDSDCNGAELCGANMRCGGGGSLCIGDADCGGALGCQPERRCPVTGELCSGSAICPNGATCEEAPRVCGVCNHGSFFDGRQLHIGPAETPLDSVACSQDADCPGAQLCTLDVSGMPCDGGAACFCRWPDQSRWKGVTQHEAGHQLVLRGAGELVPFAGHYVFPCTSGTCDGAIDGDTGQLLDPPEVTDDDCACQHVTAANGLHCLQSAERYFAALDEGIAHFNSARANNWQTHPVTGVPEEDCTFSYYKEVLSPELMGLSCGTDVACTTTPRRDITTGTKAYPPMGVDCGTAFNWRDQECGNQGVLATYATELDFLQFFWAVHAQGAPTERMTMDDIYSTLRAACTGSWSACGGEELRWESVAGVAAGAVRSLDDGAEAHLEGNAPQKLVRFRALAASHGVTPPQSP